jgi:hypothetical protein
MRLPSRRRRHRVSSLDAVAGCFYAAGIESRRFFLTLNLTAGTTVEERRFQRRVACRINAGFSPSGGILCCATDLESFPLQHGIEIFRMQRA